MVQPPFDFSKQPKSKVKWISCQVIVFCMPPIRVAGFAKSHDLHAHAIMPVMQLNTYTMHGKSLLKRHGFARSQACKLAHASDDIHHAWQHFAEEAGADAFSFRLGPLCMQGCEEACGMV